MNTNLIWPSREHWAKQRRAFYYDRFEYLAVSTRVSDYASPEEIEGIYGSI